MKIGLIFPNKDRRYKTLHLGLASIAAYARIYHNDLHFEVLDTRVAGKNETRNFFKNHFDLIGITVFSPVYFEVIEIFHQIKKKANNTPVCLGGPYVTTIKQDIFIETPAEFAVFGEGEITFTQLISYLKGQEKLSNIDGLIYKDNNKIITNPPRQRINDLDRLPFPAYDIFPMERYPLHRLVTSRGCIFSCAWCNSSSIWKDGYQEMSANKIITEIECLIANYGKKIFVFGDNTFNTNLKRLEDFCDLIIEKNIQILWSASIRADRITSDIACKMRKSGCFNVAIGIESANNIILEKIGKKTSIEKISEGIKILKCAGIEIMAQYVIGSPYDTLDTIKESISFAKKSGCDYTNFYTVLPFKNTPQWDYVLNHGKMYFNFTHECHTVTPRIVFETPEFNYNDRLEAIRLVTKEGFYSNKDTKNILFDFAKETSRKIQSILPPGIGEKVYKVLKAIYKIKVIKKNNI
ncbi:MAG: hypothetical protein A2275_08840 [Bacteroidetes bacterium RIFOXYA12_FULL_35_11]|nr:MAG: hypothetical protein A2X01_05965 [Bacteroidetes bacterium GWF2_35_48]OFY82906.1 MAG: hypothetical protein A2275_08840 [Bacteroidetes bacterium RIFOXYA12_FULL_35_11]OFZ01860.1 MAG: hypothetical protein A2491_02300 [Bacteroidetes bacterium RIFOXYC12_FULL_35_7]HBX52782.1 hypothetical protein [Bacteroidales bacterium]